MVGGPPCHGNGGIGAGDDVARSLAYWAEASRGQEQPAIAAWIPANRLPKSKAVFVGKLAPLSHAQSQLHQITRPSAIQNAMHHSSTTQVRGLTPGLTSRGIEDEDERSRETTCD